jgi:hypothetical protein
VVSFFADSGKNETVENRDGQLSQIFVFHDFENGFSMTDFPFSVQLLVIGHSASLAVF